MCALKIQTDHYLHYFFIFPVIKHWLVIIPKGLIIPARYSSSLTTPLPREKLYTRAKAACLQQSKMGFSAQGCLELMVLMFLAELS